MTDRELLELAAKAIGKTIEWAGGEPMIPYSTEESKANDGVDGLCWNPLADDGDALRLAVKLEITPKWLNGRAWAWAVGAIAICKTEMIGDDPYAATRRAIVRTAAEIGRAMP